MRRSAFSAAAAAMTRDDDDSRPPAAAMTRDDDDNGARIGGPADEGSPACASRRMPSRSRTAPRPSPRRRSTADSPAKPTGARGSPERRAALQDDRGEGCSRRSALCSTDRRARRSRTSPAVRARAGGGGASPDPNPVPRSCTARSGIGREAPWRRSTRATRRARRRARRSGSAGTWSRAGGLGAPLLGRVLGFGAVRGDRGPAAQSAVPAESDADGGVGAPFVVCFFEGEQPMADRSMLEEAGRGARPLRRDENRRRRRRATRRGGARGGVCRGETRAAKKFAERKKRGARAECEENRRAQRGVVGLPGRRGGVRRRRAASAEAAQARRPQVPPRSRPSRGLSRLRRAPLRASPRPTSCCPCAP